MYNIALVTPGFRPVPDIYGGAIEHLATVIIEENEKQDSFHLEVYTLANSLLSDKKYRNADLVQVKDMQQVIPVRLIFSIINRLCRALSIKKQYTYISEIIPLKVKKKYDMIIVENNIHIFFRLKKKYPSTPIVFHIHNDFDAVDTDYDKTKERIIKLVDQATEIWTASTYLSQHIQIFANNRKVQVFENCVDKNKYKITDELISKINKFKEENGIIKHEFVILFCGRFDKWKGALELLKALIILPKSAKVKLLLVGSQWFGSREEDQYQLQMNTLIDKLSEKVKYCGYIPQEEMPKVYGAVNLVVIPSQCQEAFGMTALEAITMGKPCVASACGGLLDILDKSCALFVPQDDNYVENLAQAICKLYLDRDLLQQLGSGALVKAEQFSDRIQYYNVFARMTRKIIERETRT